MKQLPFAAFFAFIFTAFPASAATLSTSDADLGRVAAAALTNGLEISVEIGDDRPTATHIVARFQNNQPVMQGADGLWAPWNGDHSKLDDVGATLAGGRLTFHLLDRPPEDLFYPVSFTVIYRTDEGYKSGTLVVDGP